jgi:hypothetical protein
MVPRIFNTILMSRTGSNSAGSSAKTAFLAAGTGGASRGGISYKSIGSKSGNHFLGLGPSAFRADRNLGGFENQKFKLISAGTASILKNRHSHLKSTIAIAAPAMEPRRKALPVSQTSGQVTPTSP